MHKYLPKISVLLPFLRKLEASQLATRLMKGTFWSLAGAIISRGLNLLAIILVARYLGIVGFGELGVIQSTVAMFQVLATFGAGITATKFVAEFRNTDPEKAGCIIALTSLFSLSTGAAASTAFFLGAPWIADTLLNRPELTIPLQVSSVMLLTAAWMGVQTGALAGLEAFRKITLVNLFAGLTSFPLILGGAYYGDLIGAVLGMVLASLCNVFLNSIALTKERKKWTIPINIQGISNLAPKVLQFSFPTMLAGLLWAPVIWFGKVLLVNQDNGYFQLGLYNAAYQWFVIGLFLPNIASKAFLPITSERIGNRDFCAAKSIIFNGVKYTLIFILLFTFIGALFSKQIMLLYGSEFSKGWTILVLLLCSTVFAGPQNMMTSTMAALNKVWYHFFVNFFWGILYILLSYLFIKNELGGNGLALATLISYMFKFILSIFILNYIFKTTKLLPIRT